MSVHERFDIGSWIRRYPLDRLRAEAEAWVRKRALEHPEDYPRSGDLTRRYNYFEPSGRIITVPKCIAVNEQLRREKRATFQSLPTRATDIFAFALGEPENRAATKFGGAPYRPASEPWPDNGSGKMIFVGQICFADSKDIVGELPGDVLLVFAEKDGGWFDDETLMFEWYELGLTNLIDPADVPQVEITPTHGQIHRTVDFEGDIDELSELLVWEGTKIGGVRVSIQDEEPLGAYLCSMGSLNPGDCPDQPLVNATGDQLRAHGPDRLLMWGDVGLLTIYQKRKKTLGRMECY